MASILNRKVTWSGAYQSRAIPILDWLAERRLLLYLAGLAGLNLLIYAYAILPTASLLRLYDTPHLNLYTLPEGGAAGRGRLILAFLALGLVYWQAWRISRKLQGKAAWAIVLGGCLASGLLLLFMYPYGATDIFDNILRGRILGVYGENPFLKLPVSFSNDPFYGYITWKRSPSAYGPGWEVLAGLVARQSGPGVIANVLAFKLLPGAFMAASLCLAALILQKKAPQYALAGTLLLAWNPVVLYETWGNGHNDMVMVFWMLAAVLALLYSRYTLAVLALVAGALVKFIPALLIPLTIALALRNLRSHRARASFLLRTSLLAFLLGVVAYSPFWDGVRVLNIASRTRLYSSSLPASIYYLLQDWHWTGNQAAAIVSSAAIVFTVFFAFLKSRKVWKRPAIENYLDAATQVLLFYLLVTCLWFQNWYVLWVVGLAAPLKPGATRRLALLFCFAALSKPLGIGPELFWPKPQLDQPGLEIWFTLGIFALPWSYWLLSSIHAVSWRPIKIQSVLSRNWRRSHEY